MANLGGTGGFSFGATSTPASGGFTLGGTPATQATTLLGATPATQATGGFNFGTQATGTAQTTTATPGFNFGTPASSTGLSASGTTPATKPAATGTGFNVAGGLVTQASTGFSIGAPKTTAPATGFSLGATPATITTPLTTGFGFAKPITAAVTPLTVPKTAATTAVASTGLGFGTKLGTTPSSTLGFTGGLGGLGAHQALNANTSIFGQTPAKTTSVGLGGVDLKTTTTSSGTASDGTKTSEGKAVKETQVENEMLLHVDAFQKFVKEEKSETEHIKRMSSTPMIKVQEDNAALRQLLSVVASGLQRNACNVDKLKREMTQELKNAEMAMRTKEIPPGLQYENTAPTLYFQSLVENFETQMLSYRQQIEMLENHLASIHQPNRLTAEELVLLLGKLHEAFVAMAAQLQQVHEAVKTQKEHYLNYRKVFLGDSRNIFERQKKAPVKISAVPQTDSYGQSPFPGINNAAAVAMASALTRSQQPQPQAGAPPVTGFTQSTGFGAQTTGLGGFGSTPAQTAGFKGFATGVSGSLFGNTSNLATTQAGSLFASSLPIGSATQPQLNLSTSTEQPFQLNKPPIGSKRGKR